MSLANLRDGNLKLAGVLAVVAAILTMVYVGRGGGGTKGAAAASAQQSSVYVAARDIPVGTAASTIFTGGYVKAAKVPVTAVTPGAVVDRRQLKGLVAAQPTYAGEQLSDRRFGASGATGLLSDLHGTGRVMQIAGDSRQLLGGMLQPGDHVDVVASLKSASSYTSGAVAKIVLRNLLVTGVADGKDANTPGGAGTNWITLQVTDAQARQLFFVVKNGDWTLVLRPFVRPAQSPDGTTSTSSILNGRG